MQKRNSVKNSNILNLSRLRLGMQSAVALYQKLHRLPKVQKINLADN